MAGKFKSLLREVRSGVVWLLIRPDQSTEAQLCPFHQGKAYPVPYVVGSAVVVGIAVTGAP